MTHAGGPTGAFGGAPYGATKRCTGWAKRKEEGGGGERGGRRKEGRKQEGTRGPSLQNED
eukprot:6369497-Pyramimonas_sp.AAC.1